MLYELDGLLQHHSFAHLVPRLVGLVAVWHELLQRVVTFLDGVPPLLLRGRVSLASPLLVALGVLTVAVVVISHVVSVGSQAGGGGQIRLEV